MHPARSPIIKPPRGTPLNRVHPLARGLVAAWVFNEHTGTRIGDSGGSHTGDFAANAPVWTPGGLQFDAASSQHISVDGLPDVGRHTVFAVLRPELTTWDTCTVLANSSTANSGYKWRMVRHDSPDLQLQLAVGHGWTDYYSSGYIVPNFQDVSVAWTVGGDADVDYYVNGQYIEADMVTDFPNSAADGSGYIGRSEDGAYFLGAIYALFFYNRDLSASEIAELSRNPYEMFALSRPKYFTPAVGGTSLVVEGAEHGHSAANIDLNQHHVLTVGDSVHGHITDSIDLVQNQTLAIDAANHGQSADSIDLTQNHVLVGDQSAHGHSADSIDLVQHNALTVNDSGHNHSVDNATIVYHAPDAVDLVVANSGHGHSADGVVLTQHHALTVGDAAHGQMSDNVALLVSGQLEVHPADHNHNADTIDLTQHHVLTVNDSGHSQSVDIADLVYHAPAAVQLTVAGSDHGHSADGIALDQHHLLAVDGALHSQWANLINFNLPVGAVTMTVSAGKPEITVTASRPSITIS